MNISTVNNVINVPKDASNKAKMIPVDDQSGPSCCNG